MNAAADIRRRYPSVIARAEARAAADVATGIQNLRQELADAPDWKIGTRSEGRGRHIEPTRQILQGHLRRLEQQEPDPD